MDYKSENYQMIIRVTDIDLKDAFLNICEKNGLHVSNDGETKTGIEHIELGNSISVGTSSKFQINWARNIDYYSGREIVPVYDITYDWKKIIDRLKLYISEQTSKRFVDYTTFTGKVLKIDKLHKHVIFDNLVLIEEDIEDIKMLINEN